METSNKAAQEQPKHTENFAIFRDTTNGCEFVGMESYRCTKREEQEEQGYALPKYFGTLYAKKMRKGIERGTAYYKDAECTKLFAIDPYKRIRKAQPMIFGGVPYWVEIIDGEINIQ